MSSENADRRPRATPGEGHPCPGVGANKLWIAEGRWCFCAHPSPAEGPDAWHGFPVIGGDVDERVWRSLLEAELVTRREVNRLRGQRALPEEWP